MQNIMGYSATFSRTVFLIALIPISIQVFYYLGRREYFFVVMLSAFIIQQFIGASIDLLNLVIPFE